MDHSAEDAPGRKERESLVGLALVVALLAAHNVVSNRVTPWAWYVPMNLAMAAALIAIAAAGGVGTKLGLAAADLPRGLAAGIAAGAVVGLVISLAAVCRRTRSTLADKRMAGVDRLGMLVRTFVRIPFGTVALEEIAFRSVLLALLLEHIAEWPAAVLSSLLFGAWHVLPTLSALRTNRLASSPGARLKAVGAAVAFTAVVGMLLCWLRLATGSLVAPALAHASANGTATVAAYLALTRRRVARSALA